MVHLRHTKQAADLTEKQTANLEKSEQVGRGWGGGGKGWAGNKPKSGQIVVFFFQLDDVVSLLVTVSLMPSIESSWVLGDNLYCKGSLSSVIPKPESHLGTVNYSETSWSQG